MNDLKGKMKELWKNIFHDSEEYVSLVFDTYFDEKYVEYQEENGKLVSALLGVPYRFGNGESSMNGLYLCGLSTLPAYRGKGLMEGLIHKINQKAKGEFDFTFLIPASSDLVFYYQKQGYFKAMYRIEENYTDIHDFSNDYAFIIRNNDDKIRVLKENLFDSLSIEKLDYNDESSVENVIKFISKCENQNQIPFQLIHSKKDLTTVIQENKLSKGAIYISYRENKDINGIAFVSNTQAERIGLPIIYYNDAAAFYKLLDGIKKDFPTKFLSLYRYPEESSENAIWDRIDIVPNPDGSQLESLFSADERVYSPKYFPIVYGMINVLNYDNMLKSLSQSRKEINLILGLRENHMRDSKTKYYSIKRGELLVLSEEEGEEIVKKNKKNILFLTEKELCELLFRKKDRDNLITEVFGLPRLEINMSLLID